MEMMMSISSSPIPKALYCSPLPSFRPLPFLSGQSSIVSSRSSLTGFWRQCRISSTTSLVRSRKLPSLSTLIRCAGAVREINEGEFSEVVLKSERPVLVEFVASWCGPCRLIAPAVQSLAQEYEDRLMIVKVDHDANPELIKKYKVYGLPALILFRNGQEVPESRREGAITKVKLKDYVDKLLESVSTA